MGDDAALAGLPFCAKRWTAASALPPRSDAELTGRDVDFVQDSHSRSAKNVLRGLHFKYPQGKLVRTVQGAVLDVAVDIRIDQQPGSVRKHCRLHGLCGAGHGTHRIFIIVLYASSI